MTDTPENVEELEREAGRQRREVDRELKQLRRQLTPAHLLDEALAQVGTDTEEVKREARNIGRSAVATAFDNPLPLLMIAGGLLWFAVALSSETRQRNLPVPYRSRPPAAPAPPMTPGTTPQAGTTPRPDTPGSGRPPQPGATPQPGRPAGAPSFP